MIIDKFENAPDSLVAPSRHCFAITPDDAQDLSQLPKAVYVGGEGNVVLRAVDSDSDVTFANVPAGYVLVVRASAIKATGTTATNLVGLA